MKYKFLKLSSIKKLFSGTSTEKTLLVIVGVVLFLLVFIWPISPFTKNEAKLIIDFGDKKRAFEGETFKDMTILDALNASSEAGGMEFAYAIDGDSISISRIDGYSTADISSKFLFFLNSTLVDSRQINKIKIKPGDEIRIKTR